MDRARTLCSSSQGPTAIKAASYPRSASLIYFRDSTLSEIYQRSLQPKAIRYQERSTSICSQKQRRPFCCWPLWPQHISPSNTLKCEAIPSQMVLLSGSIHARPPLPSFHNLNTNLNRCQRKPDRPNEPYPLAPDRWFS